MMGSGIALGSLLTIMSARAPALTQQPDYVARVQPARPRGATGPHPLLLQLRSARTCRSVAEDARGGRRVFRRANRRRSDFRTRRAKRSRLGKAPPNTLRNSLGVILATCRRASGRFGTLSYCARICRCSREGVGRNPAELSTTPRRSSLGASRRSCRVLNLGPDSWRKRTPAAAAALHALLDRAR